MNNIYFTYSDGKVQLMTTDYEKIKDFSKFDNMIYKLDEDVLANIDEEESLDFLNYEDCPYRPWHGWQLIQDAYLYNNKLCEYWELPKGADPSDYHVMVDRTFKDGELIDEKIINDREVDEE